MKKLRLNISIGQYVCFGICLLLMLVIPISRYHRLIGIDLESSREENKGVETITMEDDGSIVVNTTDLCKNDIGYSGPTPLKITVNDGRIVKVTPLNNQETPEFFGAVQNSDLLEQYDGLTLAEARAKHLDAVTGATYSSNAVIANMRAGVECAQEVYSHSQECILEVREIRQSFDLKWYFTLAVILAGAIIPLFLKKKGYRYLQLALNVGVLGFWGGTFISYSLMVSYLTYGITQVVMIPIVIMLVTAFIYPMFGKIDHYCSWICPYGAIQELAGKCVKKKIMISERVNRYLMVFRQILWFGLMWLLWTGLWFDWMGYEPFAAFFFRDASPVVLGIAGGFLILSFFVNRPYCRFVCPTGSLFKFSEGRG